MSKHETCSVCGQEATVSTADEGTSCYIPKARELERQEILEMLQEAYDNIIAQDESTMAYRNGLGWAIRKIKQRGEKEGE